MRKNNFLLILFVAFFLIGIISAYTYSSPSYSQFNHAGGLGGFASYSSGTVDKELCSAGTDFILQINPLDCEPAPVRSDLLEEEDVTVYCKLVATQINPLIDVEAIRYISVNGEYPKEIRSVGYFPSQSALGYTSENVLGDVALNDMGYVAITLKQNSNESSMPNYVQGNLTAKIRYDAENAFGVGQAEFYLPVLSDEEFNERILQYSFWEGRGYLRAESVGDDNAIIGIYSDVNSAGNFGADKQRVNRVALERGQTSGEMYIPGFSPCLASLKVRLNGLEDPDTTARLKINSDYIELTERSTFLDGNCRVTDIRKDGLNQKVSISCREDDDNSNFDLRISPSVKMKVGDADLQNYSVGDFLYRAEDNTKSVYLGYIGSKGDTERLEDLYVALIAIPEDKDELSESEISSVATQMNMLFSDVTTGSSVVDVSANVLKKFSGGILTGMKWAVDGNDLHVVDLKGSSGVISAKEGFKGETVSLAGFSEAQDSNFVSVEEEIYTLERTKVGSLVQQDAYKILNSNKEETGLYLLISDSGIPKMILGSDTIAGFAEFGNFYGKDCTEHNDCEQYLLSSNDLKPADAYSEFFENLIYGEVNRGENKLTVRRVSFDSVSSEDYYEYYRSAMSDYETILNSFSGEEYNSEITYGEESLYQAILLSEKIGQRKTMKDLCVEFETYYPDSKKPIKICEDVYRISNSGISSREVLVNGKIKEIYFDGIYEPSYEDYGAEILVRGPNGKTQTYQLKKDEIVYLTGLRGNSPTEETTIYTNDDGAKKVYYKYEDGWKWSTDKSNWRDNVPEIGSGIVSSENRDVIDKLKDYTFAEGDALLTSEFVGATTEVTAFTEYIKLSSVDEDSAKIFINVQAESGFNKLLTTNTYTLQKDKSEGFGSQYIFTLNDVNLKKSARVSVVPSFNYQESNTTFSFKVGIEKRAIQLSDEQISNRLKTLNKSIESWNKISDGLNTFNDALGKTCLATGAVLTVKNFIQNSDGKSIARQEVMQGPGGWNEICQKEVEKENSAYSSLDDCFFDNSDQIDERVDEVYKRIQQQDERINAIESSTPKTSLNTIDEDKFVEGFSEQVVNSLNGVGKDGIFEDPSGSGESINVKEMQEDVLDYGGWNAGNYDVEELREIELYANLVKSATNSDDKKFYEERLYSALSDVKVNAESYVRRESLADKYGMNVDLFEVGGDEVKKRAYLGGTYGKLENGVKSKIAGYEDDVPVQIVYTSDGYEYIFFLEDKGEKILPVLRNDGGNKLIYDDKGILVSEDKLPGEFRKIYFEKYDSKSYENKYLNAEVKYYEEEPYAGYPAVVPLDTKKGWYAGTRPKLGIGSSIAAYDESGRVNSFWLCNVGENGLEEFSKDSFGDDICQQINVGIPGAVYNQFYGLDESETMRLVYAAVGDSRGSEGAIQQAQDAHRDGARRVKINGVNYDVGEPAVSTPAISCTDYMSPNDCKILFNVCDPVVCPRSRCDFGGDYPVKDVVQSGVVGSIALCAPNAKEGILVPVCTTGVQAGIDSWLSVQEAYRDCLQENLETGKTIGICDEIHSVYVCEFFWRQTLPIAKLAVPKTLNKIAGEGIRGGGEYLGLQSSWENARDSLNYFTQYYASESYTAFKLRSVDEAGGEVCKNFASVVYPSGGELLDSLTTPRSPPQFSGSFDEIKMTTITNPPTSHYKVYYRVYAGKDSGAYYQVYLTGGSSSSYYQDTAVRRVVDSGYVTAGDTAVETIDFQAPSGYTTMCMVVNGQEECGFAKVSTSFAVNYVNDLYLAEQTTTKVKTEEECVSGTASLYSLLNPNAESIVDELINPALYQKGIIRICATDNPGVGTDGKVGTENERWRDVGYCGNENIRCWIDTDSVKEAIKTLDIEDRALDDAAQNYLDELSSSGDYISNEQYARNITNIKSESDDLKKINLINEIIDKVFFNNQKAELFFLRGKAYGNLSITEFSKLEKVRTDALTSDLTDAYEDLEYCEIPVIPEGILSLTDARKRVLAAAEKLDGTSALKNSVIQDYDKSGSINCFDSTLHVYLTAGVGFDCTYSDKLGKEYTFNGKDIETDNKIFFVSPDSCNFAGLDEKNKLNNIGPGDMLSIVYNENSGHNVIFINWINENEHTNARIFDWINKDAQGNKVFGYRTIDLSDGHNSVYLYWSPVLLGEGSSSPQENNDNTIEINTDVVNINILTNHEKTVYKDAESCEDCSDTYYFDLNAESICSRNLCDSIGKKLKLSCGFNEASKTCEKDNSAYLSWNSYDDVLNNFNMFADDEKKAIEEATECSDCGNGALNICGKMECKAISLKLGNVDCEYQGLGCREVESSSSGDYSFNLNELSNNQEYIYNEVTEATECSYCHYYGYSVNVCDKNLCNAIGGKINKDCVYNGNSCSELTYTGKFVLYCGYNIRETEYNSLVEFLLRNEIDISDLNCNNVYVNNGHIVSLYLPDKNIQTLQGIEKLYRLGDLRLSQNNLNSGSISPIAKLSSLHTIYLDGNAITNAYYIGSLSKLKSVHLEYNELIEIDSLKELENIEFLNVQNNCIPSNYDYSYFEDKDELSFSKLYNPKEGC